MIGVSYIALPMYVYVYGGRNIWKSQQDKMLVQKVVGQYVSFLILSYPVILKQIKQTKILLYLNWLVCVSH